MDGKILEIQELVKYLNECSYAYFVLDDPIIDDRKYDLLYDKLLKLENETNYILYNSPTQRIGDVILEKFEKSVHRAKMWSLDKVNSFEELKKWCDKNEEVASQNNLKKPSYVVMQKFDGVSINLIYENGVLTKASTRGTGEIGENVTEQIKTIKSIPMDLNNKSIFEIRGEVIMTKKSFEEYNKNSEIKLKNLRNGASGSLRTLDVNETKKRKLTTFIFDIGYSDNKTFSTYLEVLDFLKQNKFKSAEYKACESFEEIIEEITRIESIRENLGYDIDGVVIAVNENNLRDLLGYTIKHPKYSIAYKFGMIEEVTTLLDVEWNVGRSGRVSPTAILEPVDISGITIKRATLNNIDDINRKNVKIGGEVLVRRSNDVIPEIVGSVGEDGYTIPIPQKCPSCGSEIVQDGVHLYCSNAISCKPQIVKSLVHFATRDAMNIEGFNEKIAEEFYEKLNITKVSDLYKITFEDILTLKNFKDKKANNILNAIKNSKKCKLHNFIYALGIKHVGLKTSKDIVKEYKTLDRIMNLTGDEIKKIYGIGDIVINHIIKFFRNEKIREEIYNLQNLGIIFEEEGEVNSSEFTGKRIVITGKMENFSRNDIKAFFERLGAIVSDSISSKTDLLIAGENAGSKLSKAKNLNIQILTEQDFKNICEKYGI